MKRTIEIPLTRGYTAIIDRADIDLAAYKWHTLVTKYDNLRYASRENKQRKGEYLHRIILSRILGRELERGELVDHINGNGLDNRRENLRLATPTQNNRNMRRAKNNTSGYKGVCQFRGRWTAQISIGKKIKWLGSFETPEQAYDAYCKAALEYHGEFAKLE